VNLTLKQLAELVGGTLTGDPAAVVTGAAGLPDAGPADVSFLADAKRAADLAGTKAAVVIVPKGLSADGIAAKVEVPGLPQLAFAKVLRILERERRPLPTGLHPSAVVHPSAKLGAGVAVGACAVIEAGAVIGDNTVLYPQTYIGTDTVVGKDCLLYPQVVVRERCKLGDRVIVNSGSVIGSDGYGFVQDGGVHHKVPQIGRVVIEDDVEIGANNTIDRAALAETRIGAGTKTDNLVHVAHNVKVGKGCLLVGQVGIAGSTTLGDYVVLAGQVAVSDHLQIGSRVVALGQAGISKDTAEGAVVTGTPAQPVREHWKIQALTRKLPELFADVKALKEKLK